MNSKTYEIQETVEWLKGRFGPSLVVVDHWESDMAATGLAIESQPDHLVYIATEAPPTTYFVELETAPVDGSELPYATVGQFHAVDRERLATILDDHLNRHLFDDNDLSIQRYQCPCCGHHTLDEQPPGTYIICEICLWEDVRFSSPTKNM